MDFQPPVELPCARHPVLAYSAPLRGLLPARRRVREVPRQHLEVVLVERHQELAAPTRRRSGRCRRAPRRRRRSRTVAVGEDRVVVPAVDPPPGDTMSGWTKIKFGWKLRSTK